MKHIFIVVMLLLPGTAFGAEAEQEPKQESKQEQVNDAVAKFKQAMADRKAKAELRQLNEI